MSFLDIYNSLYTTLSESSYLSYVDSSLFIKGFRENLPNQTYCVILEPGNENEASGTRGTSRLKNNLYTIDIYARLVFPYGVEYSIVGYNTEKGVLEFVDDIKTSIRETRNLGYNRQGSSVSALNVSGSFDLTSSAKFISVSINGREPTGYDQINCGEATLAGAEVASNIQTALRALGSHKDDGYYDATCSFDATNNQFTITSAKYGPKSTVTVTAGVSDDCSALLGFDDPTEVVGRNIISLDIGTVATDNVAYPIRYRIIPVTITEELKER